MRVDGGRHHGNDCEDLPRRLNILTYREPHLVQHIIGAAKTTALDVRLQIAQGVPREQPKGSISMSENKTETTPTRDDVAQKAYALYVKEGRPQGHEIRNWLDAEAQMAQTPQAAPAPAAAQTEYVCPMHPQIVRSEPGSCPICGMALEPRVATAANRRIPNSKAWCCDSGPESL